VLQETRRCKLLRVGGQEPVQATKGAQQSPRTWQLRRGVAASREQLGHPHCFACRSFLLKLNRPRLGLLDHVKHRALSLIFQRVVEINRSNSVRLERSGAGMVRANLRSTINFCGEHFGTQAGRSGRYLAN
jgi:hypothetical protein